MAKEKKDPQEPKVEWELRDASGWVLDTKDTEEEARKYIDGLRLFRVETVKVEEAHVPFGRDVVDVEPVPRVDGRNLLSQEW